MQLYNDLGCYRQIIFSLVDRIERDHYSVEQFDSQRSIDITIIITHYGGCLTLTYPTKVYGTIFCWFQNVCMNSSCTILLDKISTMFKKSAGEHTDRHVLGDLNPVSPL